MNRKLTPAQMPTRRFPTHSPSREPAPSLPGSHVPDGRGRLQPFLTLNPSPSLTQPVLPHLKPWSPLQKVTSGFHVDRVLVPCPHHSHPPRPSLLRGPALSRLCLPLCLQMPVSPPPPSLSACLRLPQLLGSARDCTLTRCDGFPTCLQVGLSWMASKPPVT